MNKVSKVLFKEQDTAEEISFHQWQKFFSVKYLNQLEFSSPKYYGKVVKQSRKAMKKKQLSVREKWLGVHFTNELKEGISPRVSIRYIDEVLGYGVFAEEEIASGTFIGEYTGLIRKRKGRKDRKNDYCFEYTIGDWVYNPFIIDAKEQGNFTRFINHSEDPNIESLSIYGSNVMHIIFVSLKPIPVNAQLCYHYGDTFWKKRRHRKIV